MYIQNFQPGKTLSSGAKSRNNNQPKTSSHTTLATTPHPSSDSVDTTVYGGHNHGAIGLEPKDALRQLHSHERSTSIGRDTNSPRRRNEAYTMMLGSLESLQPEHSKQIVADYLSELHQRPGLSERDKQPFLAAVTLRHAKKQMATLHPGSSPRKVRAAAQDSPELSRWVRTADDAAGFLKQVKLEQGGPVNRAELDKARQDLSAIDTIYSDLFKKLNEDIRKRGQIRNEASQEIFELMKRGMQQDATLQGHRNSDFMRTTFGAQDRHGNWVF